MQRRPIAVLGAVLALATTFLNPAGAHAAITNTATGNPNPLGDAVDYGDVVLSNLNSPIVAMADLPSSKGYWLLGADGGVFSFGAARFFGSTGSIKLNKPVVGMSSTSTGNGYRFVARDGGVFSYGDAQFYGSAGGLFLNQPIVGMTQTPTGKGYWLVASDGGVFSYGDANFFGSTGSIKLNKPIVTMTATPSGNGYWLVASDGGIFAFGDAAFTGSTGSLSLDKPIVAMAATTTGKGYWLASVDGNVFPYGDAVSYGTGGAHGQVVAMTRTATGKGYRFATSRGAVISDSYPVVTYPNTNTNFAGTDIYAFAYEFNGQVARWDPCAGAVGYTISSHDLPPGGEQLVHNVIRELAAITGIRFRYDGLYSERATLSTAIENEISIGWLSVDEYSGPTGSDGYAQLEWRYATQRGASLRSANVEILDVQGMPWYQPGASTATNYMNVVKHELAHAVGLDHTFSTSQVMYSVTQPEITEYQPGDLQGLAYVSTSAGCVK